MGALEFPLDSGDASVISVLIVDDTRLYREGLAQILKHEPGISVDSAADPDGILPRLRELQPDVVLVHIPRPDGLRVLRMIAQVAPQVRLVILGVTENEEDIVAYAEAGAAGYVAREGSYDDLVATIRSVTRGETRCSPRIAATLLKRLATLAAEHRFTTAISRLTPREREILELIDHGLANKEIAQRLSIEVRTVKNHVHNILEKLQVHRRGEAAAVMREGREPVPGVARL